MGNVMKNLCFFILLASLSQASMAYLSQDGTRLANGQGRCAVCETGFFGPNQQGRYTCESSVVVIEKGCRPAAYIAHGQPFIEPVFSSIGEPVVENVGTSVPRTK
jgi:hypothetical protein